MYKFALAREGREAGKSIVTALSEDFEIIPVDQQIAKVSSEPSHKYRLPMGDSMIAAMALILKAVCISDDSHFKQIKKNRNRMNLKNQNCIYKMY